MMNGKKTIILVAIALLAVGCVQRDLTITSEPSGAVVYIHGMSNQEIGRTPVTIPFTWYGDYEVQLRLEGHEPLNTHANLTMPWYEIPPGDLLSELAPWTYHDRRYLHYEMTVAQPTSDKELVDSAIKLQEKNSAPVKARDPDE
jgi:hypothetical protein